MERPTSHVAESIFKDREYQRRKGSDIQRPFIAWDGEGVNLAGPGRPQSYVLFGNSSDTPIIGTKGLGLWECLDYIVDAGRRHPTGIHVGFAFGYDSNMIVQQLAPVLLGRLHKQGWVKLKRGHAQYIVTYRPHKYFQVSRWVPGMPKNSKVTVRIYDIFTFFMTSFVKAYEDMVGPVQEILSAGKNARKEFRIEQIDMIREYWELEIQNLRELAEELRVQVNSAGLPITEWHGPGALSSLSMKQNNIKSHMKRSNDSVRLASRYAYAAGRFELFKVGRILGPVYGIDRNSAYPYALTKLPSLATGEWVYKDRADWTKGTLRAFGLYHLELKRGGLTELAPSPLYLRSKQHELFFPWHTEGWYWGPEAMQAVRKGATVLESWEFNDTGIRPFAYISQMYSQRQKWKSAGNSAQMALKLCMNSMYGKLAQRVGYDPKSGRVPAWHQLEWSGWTTSLTRAAMFSLMDRIPFSQLIAVETDGIYTTMLPSDLGVSESNELGGWSIDVYDEMVYIQSGLAWLRKGTCPVGCPHDKDAIYNKTCAWTQKRRGLDWDSFTLDQCLEYVARLDANRVWPDYEGHTTRFITMGQALASKNVSSRHCVWSNAERDISVGRSGKRVHVPSVCRACKAGNSAYEQAHDLAISPAFIKNGLHSYPHHIPWEEFNEGERWWGDNDEYAGVA